MRQRRDADAGEQCDDGNKTAGDGCSATCRIEACGNGVHDAGEQCDDGNKTAGDGCSATCRIEACGNGVLDAGEQCDDGNKTAGDGCSATCRIEACGNGVDGRGRAVRRREQDGGRRLQRDVPDRGVRQRLKDAGEQCDDGNVQGGDGCDAPCHVEVSMDVPYHVEVGGSYWTDPSGQQWIPDTPYVTGGVIVNTPGISIHRTTLDPLYWTRRVGDGSGAIHFAFPVEGLGPYRVRLYFAETGGEVFAAGQRVFDVVLEDDMARITDLDVLAEAGGNRIAVVKDLYVLVDDGELDIDLVAVQGLPPAIAAIEIVEGGTPPTAPDFVH